MVLHTNNYNKENYTTTWYLLTKYGDLYVMTNMTSTPTISDISH